MPPGHAEALARAGTRERALSWAWPAVALAQAAVFFPFALLRYVDGDEGDYLLAAKLVLEGELPYRDFLYTQMPLLPYAYGVWTAVLGEDWHVARLLSALFAVAIGTLVYRHVARRLGVGLALAGVLLYTSSTLVFDWFSTVKTQALSTLLLFAAFTLVEGREPTDRRRWLAGAALLGLAIDTRLIFAGAVPAFAWAALRTGRLRDWRPRLAPLAGGLAVGLAPSIVFLALDPSRFVFDNLGYHAFRSQGGLVGDFEQKAKVAANLLGVGTPDGAVPQFLLLTLVGVTSAVALRRIQGRVPLSLVVAAWLGVASFLPTPTYPQYHATVVPFLVVGALELAAAVRSRTDPFLGRTLAAAAAVSAAVYVGLSLYDLYRYPFVLHPDQRLGPIERVAAIVDANTRPGERVLTSWPGYLFGTDAAPFPGLENAFAPHEAAALSPADARRYRLASAGDVEEAIERRRTRLVVVRLWHTLPPVPDWEGALRRGGYRLLAEVETTRVYALPESR